MPTKAQEHSPDVYIARKQTIRIENNGGITKRKRFDERGSNPHLGVNGKERTDGVHQRDEKKLKANKQSNQEHNGAVKCELRIPVESRAIGHMFPL